MDNPQTTKDFYQKQMSRYSLNHPEKNIAIELNNIFRFEAAKHYWN